MSGEIKCECGVAGVCGYSKAAYACRECLYQIQHRGQEACGIASFDGEKIYLEKREGYVMWSLNDLVLKNLPGHLAIGHLRYATTGPSNLTNAQPHFVSQPPLVFCSNGDIVPRFYSCLREELEKHSVHFQSTNDGELLAQFLAYHLRKGRDILEAIQKLMEEVVGSYAALFIFDGKLFAFRDPKGIRPLVMSARREEKEGESWLVASESCALDIVLAFEKRREIQPGEVAIFEPRKEPRAIRLKKEQSYRHCVFELIYFARPDSRIFNVQVGSFRQSLGILLGQFSPQANLVIPVPDSANEAALALANTLGLPFGFGLIRNHFVGRTFIEPGQENREMSVRRKFNPNRELLNRKSVIVVDDSIVRGTTSKKIIRMLKNAGASEVHLRIMSPPIRFPCFYGIDMKTKQELIASQKTEEEICQLIEADSLVYLKIEDLKKALMAQQVNPDDFCYACFDGKYPTPLK
jgi:amidophosphoribosyltransferase